MKYSSIDSGSSAVQLVLVNVKKLFVVIWGVASWFISCFLFVSIQLVWMMRTV